MSDFQNGKFLPGAAFDFYGTIAAPAAGTNYADQSLVGAGTRFQLWAISFTLTTSAVVANRRVQLVFRFDHTLLTEVDMLLVQAQVVQPASTTVRYLVSPGYVDSQAIVTSRVLMRLPWPVELWVPSGAGTGWTLDSDVENLDVGDQLSQARTWFRMARGSTA